MNNLFLLQLFTSFIIGGGLVTSLSFIAEKVNARIAGIIVVFPSTIAIGLFFLAWTRSAESVAKVIPAILIPLGLSVLFPAIYAYSALFISKFTDKKLVQIFASLLISWTCWVMLSLPLILLEVSNPLIGISGYALLAIMAYHLFTRKRYEKPITLRYSAAQKVGRGIFVGLAITVVVLLGKELNPFWGGVFSAFPAVFSSIVVLVHWYYNPRALFPMFRNTPIGSISLIVYPLTAMLVFPKYGFLAGSGIAYLASLITTVLLTRFQK